MERKGSHRRFPGIVNIEVPLYGRLVWAIKTPTLYTLQLYKQMNLDFGALNHRQIINAGADISFVKLVGYKNNILKEGSQL